MGSPTMVVNTRKYQSWVGSAVKASAAASASAAATSSSAASSSSAAASSPASAAAPAVAAPGLLGLLEALDLLGGTAGGSPRLEGVLGGVGLDDGPDVLTLLLALQYLDVGRQRGAGAIVDTPPSAVYCY